MLTRFRPPPQASFVSDFRSLQYLAQEVVANLHAAGIALPAPNASHQRQAKPYTALLAGPISPGLAFIIRELWRYLEAMVSEVGYAVTRGNRLSFVADITRECVLTTVRSAGRWHAAWIANGAPGDVDWVAYLIRGLPKMIHRRVPRGRLQRYRDRCDSRQAEFSHVGYERTHRPSEDQIRRLWQAICKLPALEQRCLRLHYGLFPAHHQPWRVDDIASILGIDQATTVQAILSARSAVARIMIFPQKYDEYVPLFCFAGDWPN